jgi:hypothetical protein
LPFQQPSITSKEHYRIFPKRRMLPAGWLDRDDIVVERFRPERHADNFVLREWYFLGDREYYSCEVSKDPIFTAATKCPALETPPPDAIRQLRRELRIDYGKIDYAIDCEGVSVYNSKIHAARGRITAEQICHFRSAESKYPAVHSHRDRSNRREGRVADRVKTHVLVNTASPRAVTSWDRAAHHTLIFLVRLRHRITT